MRFVYTLFSSENDSYLEQLLLSVYSLRRHNPDAEVVVFIDGLTRDGLIGSRASLYDVADVRVVEIPKVGLLSPVSKSRYLKLNCRHWVDGDMLFIDTDTLVMSSLDGLSGLSGDVHICDESEYLSTWKVEQHYLGKLGCSEGCPYFNSGVIYSKDTELSRRLYSEWYGLWLEKKSVLNLSRDQPFLAMANDMLRCVEYLDPSYNVRVHITNNMEGARILHYWAHSDKYGKKVFESIRNNGYKVEYCHIDDMVKDLSKKKAWIHK